MFAPFCLGTTLKMCSPKTSHSQSVHCVLLFGVYRQQPSFHVALVLISVADVLQPIPADFGGEAGYTLHRSTVKKMFLIDFKTQGLGRPVNSENLLMLNIQDMFSTNHGGKPGERSRE